MAYEMARNALYDYPGTALFYWLSLAREVFMRSIFSLGVGWEGGATIWRNEVTPLNVRIRLVTSIEKYAWVFC